ncbi:putative PHD type zinc finger protein with BAH domain-containing protein [Lambiella insularis]|nr:putative PHD type zinc finger protein with BAH domain-containing protein [Lambiella insularis]
MEEPPQPAGAELSVDQVAGVERRSPSIEKTHTTTPNSPTTALVEKPSHIIEVATKASAPTISTLPLAAPSPTSAPMSNVTTAESQPMTAASSTSSSIPNIQQSVANEGVGSSPYGTRSRNRNGNNRPNYAEDREQDGEYEWTTTKKTQNASTASNSAHASENDKATTSGRRRSIQGAAGSTSRTNGAGTTASKDYIPGMSSFSVNSDPNGTSQPHSKKRKAPGSHATPSHSLGQSSTSTATRHRTSSRDRRETNMLTFETSQGYLKHGKLTADDGTRLAANDHVYLVCEPPGEPYYIARIMEFVHMENDITRPVESLRVNWVYRPRDIQRKGNDTRLVYATMHSDVSSLQSLRGKCQVQHKDKIPALDEYKKVKNCFYFHQMFDRYMRRCYDVIPTEQVVNVPERVKRVLDERWKYVIVESGRGKELTGAIKSCKRCSGYCARLVLVLHLGMKTS